MNRALSWINLTGIGVLAVLCVLQWKINRQANLEVNRLESVRLQNEKQLGDQERQLQGVKADLETFRTQFKETTDRLTEAERTAAREQKKVDQLTSERDQLKESIVQWSSAVAARDTELKHANDALQKSASERNQAVEEFNKLAEKYNGTMTELNNRTKEFNALVEKYNTLANPKNK